MQNLTLNPNLPSVFSSDASFGYTAQNIPNSPLTLSFFSEKFWNFFLSDGFQIHHADAEFDDDSKSGLRSAIGAAI